MPLVRPSACSSCQPWLGLHLCATRGNACGTEAAPPNALHPHCDLDPCAQCWISDIRECRNQHRDDLIHIKDLSAQTDRCVDGSPGGCTLNLQLLCAQPNPPLPHTHTFSPCCVSHTPWVPTPVTNCYLPSLSPPCAAPPVPEVLMSTPCPWWMTPAPRLPPRRLRIAARARPPAAAQAVRVQRPAADVSRLH